MIIGSVSCLIREIWLVALYPLVGVGSAEMPMDLCQLADKVFSAQAGNDSNLLIVFYVQIMPDDLVMQLQRF